MKRTPGGVFLILVIFLQSTAAQYVYRDFDTAAPLAQYRSFTVADDALFEPASGREAELIRLAVRLTGQQLAKHRLTQTAPEEADLSIACYVFAKDRRYPHHVGYDESQLRIDSDIRRWQREGTVVVDLIDRRTDRVVWRGVAMGTLQKPEADEKRIEKAVARLFNRYPESRRGFDTSYRKQRLLSIAFAVGIMTLLRLSKP